MLSTERLLIRSFQESDYSDLYEYLSLEEIYRFEPGKPVSLEEARNITSERAKGTDFWAVVLKETGKLIGHISLIRIEPEYIRTWEIGFIFNPAYQNLGYATETSRALITYAFDKLNAHRIVGHCSPENIASWKVLEKCGMRREGLLRKNIYFHKNSGGKSRWFDSYVYGILPEDVR